MGTKRRWLLDLVRYEYCRMMWELTAIAWSRLRRLSAQRMDRSSDGQSVSYDAGRSFFPGQVVLVDSSSHNYQLQLIVYLLVFLDIWNKSDVVGAQRGVG